MPHCMEYGWDDSFLSGDDASMLPLLVHRELSVFLADNYNQTDCWIDTNAGGDFTAPVSAETIFGAFSTKDNFTAEPLCPLYPRDIYSQFFAVECNMSGALSIFEDSKFNTPLSEVQNDSESTSEHFVSGSSTEDSEKEDQASSASTPAHTSIHEVELPVPDSDSSHQRSVKGNDDVSDTLIEANYSSVSKKRASRQLEQLHQTSKKLKIEENESVSSIASCSSPSSVHTKRQRQATPPLAAIKRVSCERKKETSEPENIRVLMVPNCAVLQECKFVSKRTGVRCSCAPIMTVHKRGHLSVSCSSGHQWVWCKECCKCGSEAEDGMERRGCSNKTHWFERDAFDTGRRNHMRTAHGVEDSASQSHRY